MGVRRVRERGNFEPHFLGGHVKRLVICSLAVAVSACTRSTADVPTPAPTPPAVEQFQYLLKQGTTTIATEKVSRSGDRLEAELSLPQQRVVYTAALRPDETISRIDVQVFAPSASTTPTAVSSAAFQGDSVVLQSKSGDSTRTERRAVARNAVPYLNPSPSLMEQIVRRARAVGGATVEVPLWVPGSGSAAVSATVTFPEAGKARLSVGGTDIDVTLDASGRVMGGLVAAQNLVIERAPAEAKP
jgi:hypothetical protein